MTSLSVSFLQSSGLFVPDHWTPVLACKLKCPVKLATEFGELLPDYLSEQYNYLQYSYYKGKPSHRPVCVSKLCLTDHSLTHNMSGHIRFNHSFFWCDFIINELKSDVSSFLLHHVTDYQLTKITCDKTSLLCVLFFVGLMCDLC